MGKWRQERKLNIPYYLAKILWTSTNKGSFEFTTPVPKGVTQAFKKGQMTHCRNFESLPNLIKEKLGINSKREFAEAGLELDVALLKPSFIALLKLEPKQCSEYSDEINNYNKY